MDMSQPPMDSIKTAHVLAVDDDPSVRQMIADYLGDNEVRVTAVASGREIAEVARAERSPAEAWPVQRTVSIAAAKT